MRLESVQPGLRHNGFIRPDEIMIRECAARANYISSFGIHHDGLIFWVMVGVPVESSLSSFGVHYDGLLVGVDMHVHSSHPLDWGRAVIPCQVTSGSQAQTYRRGLRLLSARRGGGSGVTTQDSLGSLRLVGGRTGLSYNHTWA